MRNDDPQVHHDPVAQRFEVEVEGSRGRLDYERDGLRAVYLHTRVPAVLEGRGIGSVLAHAALEAGPGRGMASRAALFLCPQLYRLPSHVPDIGRSRRIWHQRRTEPRHCMSVSLAHARIGETTYERCAVSPPGGVRPFGEPDHADIR